MSTNYLLISRYPVKSIGNETIDSIKFSDDARYFISEDGNNEILELKAINKVEDISNLEKNLIGAFTVNKDYLSGDIRRELLRFVEAPIASESELPNSEFVQLRHVEVPAERYDDYLEWRDRTIFNVVRGNADKINSFEAYHSLISGQPGVMFVSSFNGNVNEYMRPFNDENYKEIIRQAGDDYITGGDEGLYTRLYRAI
ncbi:hypothetical protein [Vibrio hippocampi]|uniref:Uncharacterized protein n=1 Tax=Vibrio hippocampi TaxID=654686 RepID=A0ABM8ZN42_9VIBR|nr:hypothetical protein [Vibrio hippocampi]CAH0530002.1 hypothetical protein VHP8226_03728 [Vibrio hippocampi]